MPLHGWSLTFTFHHSSHHHHQHRCGYSSLIITRDIGLLALSCIVRRQGRARSSSVSLQNGRQLLSLGCLRTSVRCG